MSPAMPVRVSVRLGDLVPVMSLSDVADIFAAPTRSHFYCALHGSSRA